MFWRLILYILLAFILVGWSWTIAAANPIYAAMRWPVIWITIVCFALTEIRCKLCGFKGRK